ncbi:uncharacterized protein LOC116624555 [Phoca vitulina]|uniref:uncharacterized protein LOC116624555 n=1 Tax=Phoca vitulina TaxID=9720 RepID=UPI001395FD03|nr:uncharacterized protein LOC116624555 [Phoca vitulina]
MCVCVYIYIYIYHMSIMYNCFKTAKQVGKRKTEKALTGRWYPEEERQGAAILFKARVPPLPPQESRRWEVLGLGHILPLGPPGRAPGPRKKQKSAITPTGVGTKRNFFKKKQNLLGWLQAEIWQVASTQAHPSLGEILAQINSPLVGQSREVWNRLAYVREQNKGWFSRQLHSCLLISQQPSLPPSPSPSSACRWPNSGDWGQWRTNQDGGRRYEPSSTVEGVDTRPGPLQAFSQRNYRSIVPYHWLGRERKTSSHQGNKRPLPPHKGPKKASSQVGPRPCRPLASLPTWTEPPPPSQCSPSEAAREIALASASLPAPGENRESGRGPTFHNDIRQAAFFLFCFVLFCLHSSLNTVRLHFPPQCLVPPLRHSIQKENKILSSLPPSIFSLLSVSKNTWEAPTQAWKDCKGKQLLPGGWEGGPPQGQLALARQRRGGQSSWPIRGAGGRIEIHIIPRQGPCPHLRVLYKNTC